MELGQSQSDRTAWGFCLLYTLVLGAQVWASPNHATSFDSDQYLFLAQRITEGNWLPTLEERNSLGRPFNPYGLGYPYLIALFSLWGRLPLLLASKVLNMVLVGSGMWRLSRQDGFAAPGLWVTLSAPFLLLTTHTWSEAALLGLALHMAAESKPTRMLALAVLITLTRHQGIFLVLGIGFSQLLNRKILVWQFMGLLAVSLGIDLAYLGMEATQSGMVSGGSRPAASLDCYTFIKEALKVSFKSFAWVSKGLVLLLASGMAVLGLSVYSIQPFLKKMNPTSVSLASGGLFYLAGTLPLLYFFAFNEGVDLRFLGPGLLLIQMGLLSQLSHKMLSAKRSLMIGMGLGLLNLPWHALLAIFGIY